MAPLTIAPAPARPKPHPTSRVVPLLGPQIDHLHELRSLLRQAEATERQLTRELIDAMTAQGVTVSQGHVAIALLESRMTLEVDAGLFLEATGPQGMAAVTVSLTRARRLLGEADLRAIAEERVSPVLRVQDLEAPAA